MVTIAEAKLAVITDIESTELQGQESRCKAYGYTPPGGTNETILAAQRIIHSHYPAHTPLTSEIMVSPNQSLALRNILSAVVDPKDAVYVLGNALNEELKPFVSSRGGEVHEIDVVGGVADDGKVILCVDSRSLDESGQLALAQKITQNKDLIVIDIHQHVQLQEAEKKPTIIQQANVDPSRIITVDSDRNSHLPSIITASAGVIARLGIRQMIATAGMDILSQKMLQKIVAKGVGVEDDMVSKLSRGEFPEGLLAARVREIKKVPIREILGLCKETSAELGVAIPNASIGQPLSYSAPPNVIAQWLKDLKTGRDKDGELEVITQEAVRRYKDTLGAGDNTKKGTITHGANGAIYATIRALEEEVKGKTYILLAPHFSSYQAILREAGVMGEQIKIIPCTEELLPDLHSLKRELARNSNTVIIDNDPNNPSGIKRSTEFNTKMAEIIKPYQGVAVIHDDPYHSLCHDEKGEDFKGLYELLEEGVKQVFIFSGSKELIGMPAARVGAVFVNFGNEDPDNTFIQKIQRLHDHECGVVRPEMQLLFEVAIEQRESSKEWDQARLEQYQKNIQTLKDSAEKTGGRVTALGVDSKNILPAGFYGVIELPNSLLEYEVPDKLQVGENEFTGLHQKVFGLEAIDHKLKDQLQVMKLMIALGKGAAVPMTPFGASLMDDSLRTRLLYRVALGANEVIVTQLVNNLSEGVALIQEKQHEVKKNEEVQKSYGIGWKDDIARRGGNWSAFASEKGAEADPPGTRVANTDEGRIGAGSVGVSAVMAP